MSTSEVARLVRDVHRRGQRDAFLADPAAFSAGYRLTAEEREAVVGAEYARLQELGVHPMAVLFLSQVNGVPMPEYLKAIGGARGDELAAVFGNA